MLHRSLGPRDHVVGPVLLVGGDEVRVVDAGQRHQGGHLLADLGLEGGLQHGGAVHGVGQVQPADVPAANDEVVGMHHGQHVVEGDVDVLVGRGVGAQLHGGPHDHGAVVVGGPRALARLPGEPAAVGQDARRDGGAVVAAPAHEHDAELGDLAVHLEVVHGLIGRGHVLTVGAPGHLGGAVGVPGADLRVRVHHVGRADREEVLGRGGRRRRGDGSGAIGVSSPVRGGRAHFGVRCHVVVLFLFEVVGRKMGDSVYLAFTW
ncbi:hypothetical protein VTK73DRAFT_9423 [Phialemonium thermophilum]|uniref:Uncharacterized protein n=1 Tax=Phialemonium thermophilum TaxID=223376 RepID=A0ABR3W2D7_9PEZI